MSLSFSPANNFISSSSFLYGLVLGQVSVILIILIFIRFFIFASLPQDKRDYQSHIRQQRQAKLLPDEAATPSTILEKTYYDVKAHPSESVDWFTVLIAQAIAHFREDARQDDHLLKKISNILNSDKTPGFIDQIDVTELSVGDDFPIFSNCRVISKPMDENGESISPGEVLQQPNGTEGPELRRRNTKTKNSKNGSDGSGKGANKKKSSNDDSNPNESEDDDMLLEVLLDVNLSDCITLGIDTKLLLNYPRTLFAFLPVSLTVSVVRCSGTLQIALHQPQDPAEEVNLPIERGASNRQETSQNESASHKSLTARSITANDDNEAGRSESSRKGKPEVPNQVDDDEEHESAIESEDLKDSIHSTQGSLRVSASTPSLNPNAVNQNQSAPATNVNTGSSQKAEDGAKKHKNKHRPYITVSFSEFPTLEFEIQSSIGSRSKLTNVPKIAQLVEAQLRTAVQKHFVYPNERKVYLPEIWPEAKPLKPLFDKSKIKSHSSGHGASGSNGYLSHEGGEDMFEGSGTRDSIDGDSVGGDDSNEHLENGGYDSQAYIIHGTPLLHPRSFSSVSQLASNTATNLPNFRTLSPDSQDDFSAVI